MMASDKRCMGRRVSQLDHAVRVTRMMRAKDDQGLAFYISALKIDTLSKHIIENPSKLCREGRGPGATTAAYVSRNLGRDHVQSEQDQARMMTQQGACQKDGTKQLSYWSWRIPVTGRIGRNSIRMTGIVGGAGVTSYRRSVPLLAQSPKPSNRTIPMPDDLPS